VRPERRLIFSVSPATSSERLAFRCQRFAPSLDSLLDGIVSHLTSACRGNVHVLGVADISVSHVNWSYVAKNAVDLRNRNSFSQSSGPADSWIHYDFKNIRVLPTHYALLSYFTSPSS
jgi:hypothetical protein